MDLVSAGYNRIAILRNDLAHVLDLLAEQSNATLGLDRTVVLDIACQTEALNIVEEIFVGNLPGSSHKNIRTNHRICAESDTCRVHEEHLAICSQSTVQQGRIRSGDSIKNGCTAIWLDKLDRTPLRNIEVRVINNRLLRGLVNNGTMSIEPNEINLPRHHSRRRIDGICR